ncbi:MAG TPA: signal peptidase I [Syntrophorhabdaceae bacterium]|nr:signal peptidase I [Syntrophorhabdaceae bacterium]HPU28878.1 signal peptidase I [Syntrophorhabdaceae bacterium]
MERKKSKTREYIESLIIAALIAFFVRSFFVQAFKIPSSSMEPTLLIGDHLLVNRLSYVMKIPFTDIIILNLGEPERGDVIVFRYPIDKSKDFIKRVIAKGGDIVEIKDKRVYINGKQIEDKWAYFTDDNILPAHVSPKDNLGPIVVPKGAYFVMGDNRDRSLDSRFWGFVNREHLVGKALILYFSWNNKPEGIFDYVRWRRIGRLIR